MAELEMGATTGTQAPAEAAPPVLNEADLAKANAYRTANGQPPVDAHGNEVPAPPPEQEIPEGGERPQRPDNIPEKFWDADKGEVRLDEVLKANAELEKKLGEKPNTETPPEETPSAAFDRLSVAASADLEAGREISDETLKGFEKMGFPRDRVLEYAAGQQAIAELAAQKVFNEAGGVENYGAAIQWAKVNYAKADQDLYDRDVKSMDESVRLNAVRGLMARYRAATGTEGSRDVTQGGSRGGADGYRSGAEMRADMAKPEYKKDPAFRADVARKAQAALNAGVELGL